MEAKDTMLLIPQGTPHQTELCRRCAYRVAQAEYSFKAGIKEVVDWVEKHKVFTRFSNHADCGCVHCSWQAQLKEWGIDA